MIIDNKKLNRLYFIAALLIFIYLVFRAIWVPILHDEAATFFHYVVRGEFLPGYAHWDANNHILNSVLSIVFVKIFGSSLLALRIANVLFFILFAYYLFKIGSMLKHQMIRVSCWGLGLGLHGIIEFFAYSRGYGISMALLMAALYHSLQYAQHFRYLNLNVSLGFYWLAMLANVSLLHTSLIFSFLVVLHQIVRFKKSKPKFKVLLSIFLFCLSLLPFIIYSFELKSKGLLYYGEGNHIWDSLSSFSKMFFGSTKAVLNWIWILWLLFLIGSIGILLYSQVLKKKNPFVALLFPLMLGMNLLGIFVMKQGLGINYPSDRTGMYLIVLLWLSVVFIADALPKRWSFAVGLMAFFFVLHIIYSANLSYATLWKSERISKTCWDKVHDDILKNPSIGGYHMQSLQWAWYNYHEKDKLQNLQYDDYFSNQEDFILYLPKDYCKNRSLYDSIYADPYSGIVLAKRKQSFILTPCFESIDINAVSNDKAPIEFLGFYQNEAADTLNPHAYVMECRFQLQSHYSNPPLHIVCSVTDSIGQILSYTASPLEWIQANYLYSESLYVKISIPPISPHAKCLKVYLWNILKQDYVLSKGSFSLKMAQ